MTPFRFSRGAAQRGGPAHWLKFSPFWRNILLSNEIHEASQSPPFQGGVDAPSSKCREASEAGADGAVGKFQNKVRSAEIYNDASRRYQPPRLRAIWETLTRA